MSHHHVKERLKEAHAMIETQRDDKYSIRTFPHVLVHCTFPQSDPEKDPKALQDGVWHRQQNGVRIIIHPHMDFTGVQTGIRGSKSPRRLYPYGKFPRLLMAWLGWIVSKIPEQETYSREDRTIYLGLHFREFIRTFKIETRSKNKDILMSQMLRFFRSRIEFCRDRATEHNHQWRFMEFSEEGSLIWDDTNFATTLTPESYVVLGESLFRCLRRHPVPVDIRAIQALKHSAMALDLYTWSTYQTHRISNTRNGNPQPRLFPWYELMQQFGSGYRHPSEFKEKLPRILREVHQVYPELMVGILHEGLKLYPSRPAVLPGLKETPPIE